MKWSVPRDWTGETAYLVCGGPSVSQLDLSKLRNRKVVVINSSFITVPWADYLIFTDNRWWREYHKQVRRTFTGKIITLTPSTPDEPDLLLLERKRASGFATNPTHLAVWHTTVTAAINLLVHLGVKCINVLGLDGKDEGQASWHHVPHPTKWTKNPKRYNYHGEALQMLVQPLAILDVQVFNANADSAHKMFPFRSYDEMLTC